MFRNAKKNFSYKACIDELNKLLKTPSISLHEVQHYFNYHYLVVKPEYHHEVLKTACQFTNESVLNFLCDEKKLSLENPGHQQLNLLFYAALNLSCPELVKIFYKENYYKSLGDDTTIAHVAAACGDLQVLEDNQEFIFLYDKSNRTPAYYAGIRNHIKILAYFLTHPELTPELQKKIIADFFDAKNEQKKHENEVADIALTETEQHLRLMNHHAARFGYEYAVDLPGKHSLYFAVAYLSQFKAASTARIEATVTINALRAICAAHIEKNAAHYQSMYIGDFANYCEGIKKDYPGDIFTLMAMAQELDCGIAVIDSNANTPLIIYKRQNTSTVLLLGHNSTTNQYYAFTKNLALDHVLESLYRIMLHADSLPALLSHLPSPSFATHFGIHANNCNTSATSSSTHNNSNDDDNDNCRVILTQSC